MTQDWIEVCALEDIPVLGSRKLLVGTLTLALIRADEDRVYALEDRCPHKGGPFSEGIVAADRVACPLHGQCVDLATGTMVAPDEGKVQTFAVKLADGRVHLSRAELRSARAHPPLSCTA
jgi:nitrite reductase (NADH) small subunit